MIVYKRRLMLVSRVQNTELNEIFIRTTTLASQVTQILAPYRVNNITVCLLSDMR